MLRPRSLARVIASGAPLWLLDEPGNGLDADGLARLEAAMAAHRAAGGAILAATHQPLRAAVEHGRFRADLMYRLRIVPVFLPPLAARVGDVELLTHKMIEQLNDILRQALERELIGAREFRLSMSAQFQPDHAKIAREVRHPPVPGEPAFIVAVDHEHRPGLAPRIGVVVDAVVELDSRLEGYARHSCLLECYVIRSASQSQM